MRSIKCVVVGDGAVGKTSLLISYTTNTFPQDYIPTVFDNYSTTILVPGSSPAHQQVCRLNLWDTAGQEEYDRLRPLSYPQTDVFLVCFSVSEPSSLQNVVDKWWPEIVQNTSGPARSPILLVGTKADLRDDAAERRRLSALGADFVAPDEVQGVVQRCGFLGYVECSAATQAGVREVFERAVVAIVREQERLERAQGPESTPAGAPEGEHAAAAQAAPARQAQPSQGRAEPPSQSGAKGAAGRRAGAPRIVGKMRKKSKCVVL